MPAKPRMTSSHFQFIADSIVAIDDYPTRLAVAYQFADRLPVTNQRFNRRWFLLACGVDSDIGSDGRPMFEAVGSLSYDEETDTLRPPLRHSIGGHDGTQVSPPPEAVSHAEVLAKLGRAVPAGRTGRKR